MFALMPLPLPTAWVFVAVTVVLAVGVMASYAASYVRIGHAPVVARFKQRLTSLFPHEADDEWAARQM